MRISVILKDYMDIQNLKKELGRVQSKAFNYLQLENRYLKKLLNATRMIARTDFIEFLEYIVDTIVEITQAQRGAIFLCDSQTSGRYTMVVCSREGEMKKDRLDFCTTIVRKVESSGQAELIENVIGNSSYNLKESVMNLKLEALMCFPLISSGKVLGVLYLDSDQKNHNFSKDNLKLLEAFTAQASLAIEQAKLFNQIKKDNVYLKKQLEGVYRFGELIWASKQMKDVVLKLQNVLDNKVTVCIHGETGTGKELIARAIHYSGIRKNEKFISLNCGALTLSLLESELFGHKKGAFTDALSDKAGLFEAAHNGTIFLDEVGEMPPDVQVRLLRVLENSTIRRVGEMEDRKINVRIITATHRNLVQLVSEGKFREDLFYRLNVFPVTIPPLRARPYDIPVLVNHFIKIFNKELGKQIDSVSGELLDKLTSCQWLGNIRELKNTIYRLMVLCEGPRLEVSDEECCFEKKEDPGNLAFPEKLKTLDQIERDYFFHVLNRVNNNKSAAAEALGLKRSTFISKMQKLGISL